MQKKIIEFGNIFRFEVVYISVRGKIKYALFEGGVVNSKNVKALGVVYNSRKYITRHKELNIMRKFNNAKMTEEELDQVAGGLKTATFERLESGKIRLTTFVDEITVLEDGSKSQHKSEGHQPVREKDLQKYIELYTKRGYKIILKLGQ